MCIGGKHSFADIKTDVFNLLFSHRQVVSKEEGKNRIVGKRSRVLLSRRAGRQGQGGRSRDSRLPGTAGVGDLGAL